jgi:hypothetical protein
MTRSEIDTRLRPMLNEQEERIRQNARQEILYLFESVDDQALRGYVEKLESAEGRKISALVNGALIHSLGAFSDRMGRAIGESVGEEQPRK